MLTECLIAGVASAGLFNLYQQKARKQLMPFKTRYQRLLTTAKNKEQNLIQYAKHQKNRAKKIAKVDRDLWMASTSLGFAGIGALIYAPLKLCSLPILLWISAINVQDTWASYKQGRGIANFYTLSTLFIGGAILTNAYFAGSLGAFFVRLSRKILAKTEDTSVKSLVNIFGDQVRSVWLVQDDTEVEIAIEQLQVGDIIAIHAGETVPSDGTIIAGNAEIDERLLTGESQPIYKQIGDSVLAATQVLTGALKVKVEHTGQDTVAAHIGKILNETKEFKNEVLSWGESIADRSAKITLPLSALSLPLLGPTAALTILNASFGIYMMILGPVSMLSYLNRASKSGILIKDGRSLQLLTTIDTVIFDKTGTLTQDSLQVHQVHTLGEHTVEAVLTAAAAVEHRQHHPIALAIQTTAKEHKLAIPAIDDPQVKIGYGVAAYASRDDCNVIAPVEKTHLQTSDIQEVTRRYIQVGSLQYMLLEEITIPPQFETIADTCQTQGHTLVYIAVNQCLIGAVELKTTIRPEAKTIVQALKQRNLDLAIISGDQKQATQQLADQLGIQTCFAETLPEGKAKIIQQLQAKGRAVCYIGDGINDTIALKQANVSVSLQGAANVATDVAQIILMKQDLYQMITALDIAKAYKNNIRSTKIITTLPGFIIVTGAVFYGFGVLHSVIINGISLFVGVGNTMRINLKNQ